MKWFLLSALGVVFSAGVFQATAEARAWRGFMNNSKANVTRSASDEYQPRTRGAYVKPSFYQGSHKALGKY